MPSRATPDQNPPEPAVRLARELLADTRRLLEHPALVSAAPLDSEVRRVVTRDVHDAQVMLRSALEALDRAALREDASAEPGGEGVRFYLSFREDQHRG